MSSPIWLLAALGGHEEGVGHQQVHQPGHAAGLLVHGAGRALGDDAPVGAGHAGAVEDVGSTSSAVIAPRWYRTTTRWATWGRRSMWRVSSGWPSSTTGALGPSPGLVRRRTSSRARGSSRWASSMASTIRRPAFADIGQPGAQAPGEAGGGAAGGLGAHGGQDRAEQGRRRARRVGDLGHREALAVEGAPQRLGQQRLARADLAGDHHEAAELGDAEQDAGEALAVIGPLVGEAGVRLEPEGGLGQPPMGQVSAPRPRSPGESSDADRRRG